MASPAKAAMGASATPAAEPAPATPAADAPPLKRRDDGDADAKTQTTSTTESETSTSTSTPTATGAAPAKPAPNPNQVLAEALAAIAAPPSFPIEATKTGVIIPTNEIPNTPVIEGFHFDAPGKPVDYDRLFASYARTGFQASNLGAAIHEINRMRTWRLSDEPLDAEDDVTDPEERRRVRAKIFLGYTSNLVSSGLREVFVWLAKHRLVDVIVSSAGGIEEDFMKCMGSMFMGEFSLKGSTLRAKGLNRIGNILAPNENYCKFEAWIEPILDAMLKEQNEQGVRWTPSKFIRRLGKEINDERSIYYWCYKNDIPVFCPSITDGTIGDFLYFHSYKNPGLELDIVADMRAINDEAVHQRRTGVIILGGGLVKHHIFNANLMRNGADHAVIVSTAQEFDGSDSGAALDEAVSWGKIRPYAKPIKVFAEATLVFPVIVAQTFAKGL